MAFLAVQVFRTWFYNGDRKKTAIRLQPNKIQLFSGRDDVQGPFGEEKALEEARTFGQGVAIELLGANTKTQAMNTKLLIALFAAVAFVGQANAQVRSLFVSATMPVVSIMIA